MTAADRLANVLLVTIEADQDTPSPLKYGGFNLISWCRNYGRSNDANDYYDEHTGKPTLATRNKIRAGTAFPIGRNQDGGITAYEFDYEKRDGILVWEEKPKDLRGTPKERAESANAFADEYSKWVTGDCWYYSISKANGDDVDSCGGFIGSDYFASVVKEELAGREYTVVSDPAQMAGYLNLGPNQLDDDAYAELQEEAAEEAATAAESNCEFAGI